MESKGYVAETKRGFQEKIDEGEHSYGREREREREREGEEARREREKLRN